jgi:hypothetical protein
VFLCIVLGGCRAEKTEPPVEATTPTTSATPATSAATAPAAAETAPAATESTASDDTEDSGVWAGQITIDAQAGLGTLNYVGAESGDFVPFRFRTGSDVGTTILAQCADGNLCEVEGKVRFLDEPPPENASAVGEIISVTRVKKLPDA